MPLPAIDARLLAAREKDGRPSATRLLVTRQQQLAIFGDDFEDDDSGGGEGADDLNDGSASADGTRIPGGGKGGGLGACAVAARGGALRWELPGEQMRVSEGTKMRSLLKRTARVLGGGAVTKRINPFSVLAASLGLRPAGEAEGGDEGTGDGSGGALFREVSQWVDLGMAC